MNTDRYGLKLDTPSPEHWVFGSTGGLPMEILQTDKDWRPYIIEREVQNLNGVEPYACVIYSTLRCVEMLILRKYGLKRDYSKRYLAAIVGTQNGGSSPQDVAEALRTGGVVNEDVWPFDATIDTTDKFFAPIPQAIQELAKEFNAEWNFGHDFVPPNAIAISSALECSPLLMSFTAWFKNDKGRYYRPTGMQDNHAIPLVFEVEADYRQIYDSYYDTDGDASLKELEWADLPTVVKRFYISRKTVAAPIIKKSFWESLCFWK